MYWSKSFSKTMIACCGLLALSGCNSDTVTEATKQTAEKNTYSVEFSHWAEPPVLENKDAEILAMESSGELVTPLPLYERTVDDLVNIRNSYPDVSVVNVGATAGYKMTEMLLGLDKNAMALFDSGNYSQWDQLNQKFGVLSVDKLSDKVVKMQFERGYNIPKLAELYMDTKLEGITFAEPNFIIGASQDICLENLADENRIYMFKQGEGDCPAGCITKHYAGFKVDANQVVTNLGQFSTFDNTPDWYENNQECKRFL